MALENDARRLEAVLLLVLFLGGAGHTVLQRLIETRSLPADLEQAVQVLCDESVTDASEELPEQEHATRFVTGNGTPIKAVGSLGEATGTVTPATTA